MSRIKHIGTCTYQCAQAHVALYHQHIKHIIIYS